MSIAVLGTDGAGKTTVINGLRELIIQKYSYEVYYEHMRPNWLPALGVAAGRRKEGDGSPVTDPHAQKPSGFFGSLIRLCYYWMDYLLGYWMKTRPRLKNNDCVCIFDRYFYDLIIDPKRMRINLPSWIARTLFYFVPKPDLVICLGADPEVLYARKPETSLEEVTRQVETLKKLCENTKNAVWIDTELPVEESINQAFQKLSLLVENGERK